jgi:hypothetical protein
MSISCATCEGLGGELYESVYVVRKGGYERFLSDQNTGFVVLGLF